MDKNWTIPSHLSQSSWGKPGRQYLEPDFPGLTKEADSPWQTVEDPDTADYGAGSGCQADRKSWFASGSPSAGPLTLCNDS